MRAAADHTRSRSIVVYLVLACLITWLLWIPPLVVAGGRGWLLPSPDNYAPLISDRFEGPGHILWVVVFTLAVYGPLVAAWIATSLEQGRRGVRDWLSWIADSKATPRWFLIALLLAAVLSFVPTLLGLLTDGLADPILDAGARLAWFLPILLLQLLTSGLGEEPGWRGFLLPRLQERFRPVRATWLLGLAWALWHYPLTAVYAWRGIPADAPPGAGGVTVVVALLFQTIGIIGMTYIYVWLFNRTRSVVLMIVFHALTNALPFLVAPAQGPVAFAVGLVPWLVVAVLWLLSRGSLLRPPASARHS